MFLHESALIAMGVTVALAVLARALRAVDTSGAVAGVLVGCAISAGLGLRGLVPLGTFFFVGSAATRIGWSRKRREGTAERGGGARDWRRVFGKGGVAAVAGFLVTLGPDGATPATLAMLGALAAALADTLGTEIGTLARGRTRSIPAFRTVAPGTPGAVSLQGTGAALLGGVLIAGAGVAADLVPPPTLPTFILVAVAGLLGTLAESWATGVPSFARASGEMKNVWTTFVGAFMALGARL